MKKRMLALALSVCVMLSGCGQPVPDGTGEENLTVVATTYPIYLFASALTGGVEGVEVERLDTGSTSCLHDYNLTVNDMKKIERADLLALNGAGLEEFMHDALEVSGAPAVDCSVGVELLENQSHHHEEGDDHGHDHGHFDPHYWMDPANAHIMVENLKNQLVLMDQTSAALYQANALSVREKLEQLEEDLAAILDDWDEKNGGLVTFHDGFHYFAHAYDLPLLESIEEEAGSEASAKEIVEITGIVREFNLPVIFAEVNGSDATARAITRETGCTIAQLSMVMDGPDDKLENYCDALLGNARAIMNGFAGQEVFP